jgi:hypothetical protein
MEMICARRAVSRRFILTSMLEGCSSFKHTSQFNVVVQAQGSAYMDSA